MVLVFPDSGAHSGVTLGQYLGICSDLSSGSTPELQLQGGVANRGRTVGTSSEPSHSAPGRGSPGVSMVTRSVLSAGGRGTTRANWCYCTALD